MGDLAIMVGKGGSEIARGTKITDDKIANEPIARCAVVELVSDMLLFSKSLWILHKMDKAGDRT